MMLYSSFLISDDANTVAHAGFLGPSGGIFDSKRNVWTQNGTVPQIEGRTMIAGAGPFSDVNYYSLASASALNFAGGVFSVAAVFKPSVLNETVLSNSDNLTKGYDLHYGGVSTVFGNFSEAAGTGTGVPPLTTAVNVVCFGRDAGSNTFIKMNLAAAVVRSAQTSVADTTDPMLIGRNHAAGNSMGGIIYEVWFSTTTPTDALFTSIQARVKNILGITAW